MVSGYFDGKTMGEKKEVGDTFCNIVCAYFIFQRNFVWALRGLCYLLGDKAFYSLVGGSICLATPTVTRAKKNPQTSVDYSFGVLC